MKEREIKKKIWLVGFSSSSVTIRKGWTIAVEVELSHRPKYNHFLPITFMNTRDSESSHIITVLYKHICPVCILTSSSLSEGCNPCRGCFLYCTTELTHSGHDYTMDTYSAKMHLRLSLHPFQVCFSTFNQTTLKTSHTNKSVLIHLQLLQLSLFSVLVFSSSWF